MHPVFLRNAKSSVYLDVFRQLEMTFQHIKAYVARALLQVGEKICNLQTMDVKFCVRVWIISLSTVSRLLIPGCFLEKHN